MYYWMFMLIAIIAEVFGTLSMKYTIDHSAFIGISIMYLMLIISYSALAIAVKRIPLALAYGAWESVGLVLIVIFSALLFSEELSPIKVSAIMLIISGMLLLHHGIDLS